MGLRSVQASLLVPLVELNDHVSKLCFFFLFETIQVFREFYPKDEECFTLLDCVWKTDKYVLLETLQNLESSKPVEETVSEDVNTRDSLVQYQTSVSSLGGKNLRIITIWFCS